MLKYKKKVFIMPKLEDWLDYKNNTVYLSNERYLKVQKSLTKYAYSQIYVGMVASLFCATVIFIGLFDHTQSNFRLYIWTAFFLVVTSLRTCLSYIYKRTSHPEKHLKTWSDLYIVGALLGGISWGLTSIILLPQASLIQQVLIILMLAGVTAGAVALSAAIPTAAILFLLTTIVPLILTLVSLNNQTFLLFDLALIVYFLYTIIITTRAHRLIKNSIILQFENDALLSNLEVTNKKLKIAATHDPLTEVANRRLFKLNLNKAISHAKENKKLFALFYIDLDNFKLVNDLYGHHMGDEILLIIIGRLRNYFRKNDIIARLGGDELAIIIENMTSKNDIVIIAKKICQLIALPIKVNDIKLSTSASIGISIFPLDGKNEDALLRCADKCMYYAKDKGGNDYYFSHDLKELA
jgi:diguanylate cyclase (GGDEF)-like protein